MAAEKIVVLVAVAIPAIMVAIYCIIFNISELIKRECTFGDFFRGFGAIGVFFGFNIWWSLDYVFNN